MRVLKKSNATKLKRNCKFGTNLLLSVGNWAKNKFTFWFGWSDVSLQFITLRWSLCYSPVDRLIAFKWTQGSMRRSQRKVHSRQVEEGGRLT